MTVENLKKVFLSKLAPEDFFVLLACATGKDKAFLLGHPKYELSQKTLSQAKSFFTRRQKHEPVAYIVGEKEFYGRAFRVTPATLIPRPETELIVELALNKISNFQFLISNELQVVDVGTGSGNIIISIAKEVQKVLPADCSLFFGIDISSPALSIAKENAKMHHLEKNITFLEGDLLVPYLDRARETKKDILITANLPYLSHTIYRNTEDDVRLFEPRSALQSEKEGLDHYFRLLEMISTHRTSFLSITLFLEISPEQKSALSGILFSFFPQATTRIHKDLAQRDRVMEIRLS